LIKSDFFCYFYYRPATATLTTVGFGDVVACTAWGKILTGVFSYIGVLFVALPTGEIVYYCRF
jgi:voltage-gated potassium channel Kch